jgi:regulator of protease activity HflC (stomatin/prohibitin superfamily)
MVDKGKINELVAQLRMTVPQEIRRAEEMLSRKDDIMSSAVSEAHQTRQQLEQDFRTRLSEHELVRKAEEMLREAELTSRRMIDQAEREAENRRNHADAYALRTLRDLERDLAAATGSIRKGIDVLAGSALAAGSNTPVPSPEDFAPEEPAQTFSRR